MKKIELKAKEYAKRYIANNFNGTATVKELYNVKKTKTATSIATENLSKPVFQKAIEEALTEVGLTDEEVSKIQQRNLKQNKSYSASNSAIDIYHRLKGNYKPETTETRSVNLNIDLTNETQVNEAINSLIAEIKALTAENDIVQGDISHANLKDE